MARFGSIRLVTFSARFDSVPKKHQPIPSLLGIIEMIIAKVFLKDCTKRDYEISEEETKDENRYVKE
jgi:hypothetical protein